jgi:histidyl-tRNA synthetase
MKLETPPGTRDFLPEEMVKRQEVVDKIRATFELYGFSPAETPAFEYAELLEGKYGDEEKLIYKFEDLGGRKLALRYDLTVPLVRVFAMNQLPIPFKRYCISRVWRFDRPQKGRYREFWQCDIDIVGVASMKADAEIIACAIDALESLGLRNFKFKVNSRKVLDDLLNFVGIEKNKELDVFRALDKLEKIGEKEVRKEFKQKGVDGKCDELLKLLRLEGLRKVREKIGETEGLGELEELFKLLKLYKKEVALDLSMVRGLDYYTGPIFEVELGSYGAIAGGGRYDKLIGEISGKDTPAVGMSLGIERIIEVMREKKLLSEKRTNTGVYLLRADEESGDFTLQLLQKLRASGIPSETDLLDRNFSNQMKYAGKSGVEKVVIVGQKDLKSRSVTVKDMKTGEQKTVKVEKILEELK